MIVNAASKKQKAKARWAKNCATASDSQTVHSQACGGVRRVRFALDRHQQPPRTLRGHCSKFFHENGIFLFWSHRVLLIKQKRQHMLPARAPEPGTTHNTLTPKRHKKRANKCCCGPLNPLGALQKFGVQEGNTRAGETILCS